MKFFKKSAQKSDLLKKVNFTQNDQNILFLQIHCNNELTNQLGAIVFGKMDEFLEKVQTSFEPLLLPPSFKNFLLRISFFLYI